MIGRGDCPACRYPQAQHALLQVDEQVDHERHESDPGAAAYLTASRGEIGWDEAEVIARVSRPETFWTVGQIHRAARTTCLECGAAVSWAGWQQVAGKGGDPVLSLTHPTEWVRGKGA